MLELAVANESAPTLLVFVNLKKSRGSVLRRPVWGAVRKKII